VALGSGAIHTHHPHWHDGIWRAGPAAATPRRTAPARRPRATRGLAQARARLPFPLRLPAWAPEGYQFNNEISIAGAGLESGAAAKPDSSSAPTPVQVSAPVSAHAVWRHAAGYGFGLSVMQRAEDLPGFFARGIVPVPPGGVHEVRVAGKPAALITRQFQHLLPSNEIRIGTDPELRWEAGGLAYSLRTFRNALSEDEVLRIAESLGAAE